MFVRIFRCEHCGNIATKIEDSGVPMVCCGERMKELEPSHIDELNEKHVPEIKRDCNKITVYIGAKDHPMTEEHYIRWVCVETDKGFHVRYLKPGEKPKVTVTLDDEEKVLTVFAYCNLHGLWSTQWK